MSVELEIEKRIHRSGKSYHDWYVGVADNAQERLFKGHNVNKSKGAWLYRNTGSALTARGIEAIFVKKGCKCGDTRKEHNPCSVYVYKMTPTTRGSQN